MLGPSYTHTEITLAFTHTYKPTQITTILRKTKKHQCPREDDLAKRKHVRASKPTGRGCTGKTRGPMFFHPSSSLGHADATHGSKGGLPGICGLLDSFHSSSANSRGARLCGGGQDREDVTNEQ